jgi:hypothetical protein
MLSVKEKEKYVIQLREQKKTYREIARQLLISPREISKILKKGAAESEKKERNKIVLSKEAKALQLFKGGKSPIDVSIKLDLSAQEAKSLYLDYLSLDNSHNFIEKYKQFENVSLQHFIKLFNFMKENNLDGKEIVKAVKMINDLPKIEEEYNNISNELKDLRRQRDFYLSDNKFLKSINSEMNNEYNTLLSKKESMRKSLVWIETELTEKTQLVDSIKNSEEFNTVKNKIQDHVSEFLNRKKDLFRLTVRIILDIIKEDPENKFFVNNILNPNISSPCYLKYYEDKIAQIADRLQNRVVDINTNML